MITWLNVPFNENGKAKSLGAKWSIAHRRWFVENVDNIHDFLDWVPDHLKRPVAAKKTGGGRK